VGCVAPQRLSDGYALVTRSADKYQGWGDAVIFEACTAARIGEVSGCLVRDISTDDWIWTVRRQTTPSPGGLTDGQTTPSAGGLVDKNTKGRRARQVPLIDAIRDLVLRRIDLAGGDPDARLFTGPRGGRISTATLRDATSWDEVVTGLGYEHLKRHRLRHTGLTWMADAGVPLHTLRKIAGHADLGTTQRYLHPDRQSVTDAGKLLSGHLWSQNGPKLHIV
jgi:integrase